MKTACWLGAPLIVLVGGVKAREAECLNSPQNETKEWKVTKHTFFDFFVAGVNLAQYKLRPPFFVDQETKKEEPFALFEDFDISHLITGNEGWDEILAYRNTLERPSLSFYVDKVARKRWLPTQGYKIPRVYALQYASEVPGKTEEEQVEYIYRKLPAKTDYAAKPTHFSEADGTLLVSYDAESGTSYSIRDKGSVDAHAVAISLVQTFQSPPRQTESWALKNVKGGYVVEELWSAHDDDEESPHEFCIFTIWGRVWVGAWWITEDEWRIMVNLVHRNGTLVYKELYEEDGEEFEKQLPDWLDWSALVKMAEELGAHKDMFRLDVFVGVPTSVKSLLHNGATEEERLEHLEIAISESEIFPTTPFNDFDLTEEAARLWIAGYKIGNYRVVPNTEVPDEFKQTGKLSEL